MFKTLRIRKNRQCAAPVSSAPAESTEKDLSAKMTQKSNDTSPPKPSEDKGPPPSLKDHAMPSSKTASISSHGRDDDVPPAPAKIMIAGGGIVGLLMALALDKYVHVKPEIYEQAQGFDPDVGAGMGLYANGLRVIQDIDPALLKEIQDAGHPYLFRIWERHDGTEVAVAEESVLGSSHECPEEEKGSGLQTMGIRRWRLQQCLHAAVEKAGIPIFFGKKVLTVSTPTNGTVEVIFTDGTQRQTQLLIGADGARSAVRTALLQNTKAISQDARNKAETPSLSYTGVTCIMGVAEQTDDFRRGISIPVASTTQCHGAFYPTGSNELCFQFHFPIPVKQKAFDTDCKQDSCWGNLSQQVSREACQKLAEILQADGWHEEKFLRPLRHVTRAVRVGFCQLKPALKHWSFPNAHGQPRIILVGDSAHPPVPYIGQGAQQGMEDVGTLGLLLKALCLDDQGDFDLHNLQYAINVYERLRIPRVEEIFDNARLMGTMQQKRAQNPAYNIVKEEKIQRDLFFHETMPIMFPGARHDYRQALDKELELMAKAHKGPPLQSIAET